MIPMLSGLVCFVAEPSTPGISPLRVHSTGLSTLFRTLGEPFIYLFNVYCIPDAVLGTGDTTVAELTDQQGQHTFNKSHQ